MTYPTLENSNASHAVLSGAAASKISILTLNVANDRCLLISHPEGPHFPATFAFFIGCDLVASAHLQKSTTHEILGRTKVFAIEDLAWIHEERCAGVHRPVAAVEFWFALGTMRFISSHWGENNHVRDRYLERLANIPSEPGWECDELAATEPSKAGEGR